MKVLLLFSLLSVPCIAQAQEELWMPSTELVFLDFDMEPQSRSLPRDKFTPKGAKKRPSQRPTHGRDRGGLKINIGAGASTEDFEIPNLHLHLAIGVFWNQAAIQLAMEVIAPEPAGKEGALLFLLESEVYQQRARRLYFDPYLIVGLGLSKTKPEGGGELFAVAARLGFGVMLFGGKSEGSGGFISLGGSYYGLHLRLPAQATGIPDSPEYSVSALLVLEISGD